jgi:hypothetical protein
MFWNRRQVYCGTSIKEFSDTRNHLENLGIKYTYRVKGGGGRRMKTLYYVYIHEKDSEKACRPQKTHPHP